VPVDGDRVAGFAGGGAKGARTSVCSGCWRRCTCRSTASPERAWGPLEAELRYRSLVERLGVRDVALLPCRKIPAGDATLSAFSSTAMVLHPCASDVPLEDPLDHFGLSLGDLTTIVAVTPCLRQTCPPSLATPAR
jgi:hypothetical protein